MASSRFGFTLATAVAVLFSGCASSGGGGGAGGGGGGGGGGVTPRETANTRQAEFIMIQFRESGNEDPAAAAEAYQRALTLAMTEMRQDPSNPHGYYLAGRAQMGLEQYEAADSLLDRALRMYGGYADDIALEREAAWANLFNASLESLDGANEEEGLQLLEAAEMIFPGMRPEALMNMAITYGNMQRYDEAADAYAQALAVIESRIDEVNEETAASWRERAPTLVFNRARVLTMGEKYDEAAAAYTGYLESNPDDIQALSGLAQVLTIGGQTDSAQVIYNTLLEMPGLGIRAYVDIGVGLYQADVYDQAARAFRAATSIAPENRDAVFNLAQSLFEGEDWDALIPVAQALMELDRYNPQTYVLLGYGLARTGREQEAAAVLEEGQNIPFKLEGYSLQLNSGGGGVVGAILTNATLEAGTPIEIRVHFSGEDGSQLGTVDVRIEAPPQEQARQVTAQLTSREFVAGYYFEVLSPR